MITEEAWFRHRLRQRRAQHPDQDASSVPPTDQEIDDVLEKLRGKNMGGWPSSDNAADFHFRLVHGVPQEAWFRHQLRERIAQHPDRDASSVPPTDQELDAALEILREKDMGWWPSLDEAADFYVHAVIGFPFEWWIETRPGKNEL